MRTSNHICRACAVACLAAAPTLGNALDLMPDGAAAQAGVAAHGTGLAGVGIIWNWDFQRMRRSAELTAHTEVMLNHLRADALAGGQQSFTQVVVLPSLRMRLDRGSSPWFIELGIGASWMDRLFVTPDKEFSTRWNFYDMLGLGYTLAGPQGKHEIGLRWVHLSNAGLKKPNPGLDFLQLRYVARF